MAAITPRCLVPAGRAGPASEDFMPSTWARGVPLDIPLNERVFRRARSTLAKHRKCCNGQAFADWKGSRHRCTQTRRQWQWSVYSALDGFKGYLSETQRTTYCQAGSQEGPSDRGESGDEGVRKDSGGDEDSLVTKLKAAGIAGVLSYGILNTFYYLGAFLLMFLYVAPVERGAGLLESARRCAVLLALVWGGSQVTKIPRMLGALLLTPWIDRLLTWLTRSNRVQSKGQALALAAAACFGLAAVIFGALILLWA